MSFLINSFTKKDQAALDPPMTPAEQAWWSKARVKHYRSALLGFSLPFFVVFTVSMALTKPEKLLWGIPFNALLVIGMGLLLGRTTETARRKLEISWKRIRESIVADSPDERP